MDTVLAVLAQAVWVIVAGLILTAIIRRILAGVGWLRSFLVSVVVMLVGLPVSVVLGRAIGIFTPDGRVAVSWWIALIVSALAFLWLFVAAISILVVAEVVLPTGAAWTPMEAWQQTAKGLRRQRRYAHLSWVIATSGLWRSWRRGPASEGFGEALVGMLERSGVTFIKLGQILSTRPDVLPPAVSQALSTLQSSAARVPAADIRDVLREEWGADPGDVLGSFDDEPLAAASVAQVHRATLRDGTPVVVKVQRPGAREQVAVDCDIVLRFTEMAERRLEWARAMGVAALGRGLVATLREELDDRVEARNTLAVSRTLEAHPDIVTPVVDEHLSTARVLVMTRLEGRGVLEAAPDLPDGAGPRLAQNLMDATLEGILVRGVFHADLHPGNIMVVPARGPRRRVPVSADAPEGPTNVHEGGFGGANPLDVRLGLLDFGSVGVIDAETRQLLATLLLALVTDDDVSATTAVTMAFDVTGEVDPRALQRDLGRILALLAQTRRVDASTFSDVFAVLHDHGIAVPGDVAGAFRTLTSLEGALQALDPGYGLYEGMRRSLPALVRGLASPTRTAGLAASTALTSAAIARRLPARVERVTEDLERGRFQVRTRAFASAGDRAWLRSLLDDAVSAVFAVVAIALACVFLVVDGGPQITEALSAYDVVAGGLGFAGIVLVLRLVVRLFTRSR